MYPRPYKLFTHEYLKNWENILENQWRLELKTNGGIDKMISIHSIFISILFRKIYRNKEANSALVKLYLEISPESPQPKGPGLVGLLTRAP